MQTGDTGKLCPPAMLAVLEPGPVYDHLALESILLQRAPAGSRVFLLYRSKPAVVIGKHQIPWEQARLRLLAAAGVPIARRVTGGGAVWHDEGNLNWCFLEPADLRSRPQRLGLIIAGLRAVGLAVHAGERGDIWMMGRKVSGTALAYRRGMVLHHGTLLVNSHLAGVRDFLRPATGHFIGRGVASVPSPVMNLADAQPGLTPEDLIRALLDAAGAEAAGGAESGLRPEPVTDPAGLLAGVVPGTDASEARDVLGLEAARLSGWDWVYGRSPDFRYRGSDGGPEIAVSAGRLKEARGAGGELLEIPLMLQGLALSPGELDRVRLAPQSSGILACIRQLFG